MDRKAALGALVSVPFLALVCWYLTTQFTPIWGYLGTLTVYWTCVLIPILIWRGTRADQLALGKVTKRLFGLALLPVVMVGCVATYTLWQAPIPIWAALIVIGIAVCNGTLEELFWRGTVQTDSATVVQMGLGVALFTGCHVALLAAQGVTLTGGPLALLAGAMGGGVLWTYLRSRTGTVGLAALSHIGMNIAAFLELTSHNLT